MTIDLNGHEPHRGRQARPQQMDERPRIESALAVLDPDCDRETWVRIGQAIQDELGEDGFSLWDEWSRTGSNYREASALETWRSFGQGRGITIGTLFKLARDAGWSDNTPAREMTPEEVEARRRSREEAARKNAEEAERVKAQARAWSAAIIAAAHPARPDHPYLTRKRVRPSPTMLEIGAAELQRILGYHPNAAGEPLTGRVLVIPLERFGEPGPCTVEMVDESGRKAALAGPGTKTGAHGCLSAPQQAPDVVLIGEGAATVLSALEALAGRNVAGFMTSCNTNMPKVAQAIRTQYPAAQIVLLADLKKDTGEPDPKAMEAAQACSGLLAVPNFGPGWTAAAGTDFNDLAIARGPEAVRACIEAAHAAQAPSIWDQPADIAAMLATQPEPMQWLIKDRIPFARGGGMAALGGTGKTTFLKVLGGGCITGRLPMDEWRVERIGKVVLVLTEDTHAEFHEDLHRLCHGMTTRERELIARNLIVYPLAGKDTRLLTKSPRGVVEKSPLYQSLIAKIQAIGGVVLVGLDPALGISEGDEMSQADQRALGRAIDDLAVTVGATCILLAHSTKALLNANELGSHSSRGGGALTDALRFEITMRGMTATEATAHGIEDLEERLHLVQVAITKGNRVPPAAKVPVWLRYDSGTLVSAGLVEPEKKSKGDGGKLPKSAALVFEALKEATMEHGQIDDATGRPYVALDDLRTTHKDLYTQRNPARTDRAERMALQDGSARLIELGMIESDGLIVSFAGPGAEVHFANVAAAIAERQGRKFGRERKFSEVSSAQDGSETAEGSGSVPLYKGTFLPQTSGGDLQAFPDEVTL